MKDGVIVQASTSAGLVTEADVGQYVVETVVSIMPQVVPTAGSKVEQTEISAIADQQLIQAQATAAASTSVDPVTEADEGQAIVETVVSIMPQIVPTARSKVEQTEIPAIADQQLIKAQATAAAASSVDPVTEADVGQSVVETVVSIMPQVVPTAESKAEQTAIPAIADQQLIQAQATTAATTSVDPITEADEGQSVVETVVSIMPQVVPTAGSKVEQTEIPAIADQQLIQAQATAAAASLVDPVTEADEGQSVVETVVSIMPQVVPTAGSKVEQTEISAIADQQLIQAIATAAATTSVDPVTEADEGQSVVETAVSIMPEVVPTAGSEVEQTEIPAIADQQLIQAIATAAATTSVDPITEADEGQFVVETVVSIMPQEVPTAGSKVEQTEIPAIADQQLIQAQATAAAASSVDPVTEADEGQSVVETVVSIMPHVVPTAGSEVEQTEIPAIADQQLIQAIATAAATTSVDPITEADEGQFVVETVVSIMPQEVPTAGSKVEQTEIPAIADQQLIQAQATAAAASLVDPVTEADEGQSVVETVVSIMPQVVPTAGSKVELTEIQDIDQPLMQAQATTEAAGQEMIEKQAAVQNSNGLDQSGDVVSQDLGGGWGCKVDI